MTIANPGYVEGSIFGVRNDNSKWPGGLYLNTTYATPQPATGVWHRMNVVEEWGVPADVKSVFFAGLFIITHGALSQVADLTLALRAPGDDMVAGNYIGQTCEACIGGGQRSNMASWCPVVDGEIEWQWNYVGSGHWPDQSCYAINLSLQAYVR